MSSYDLIAMDMDGTVLNSRKEITKEVAQSIHRVLKCGKEAVFCTGRAHAEMGSFLDAFPDMHYLIAESGAYVYDLQAHTLLFHAVIPHEDLVKIFEVVGDRDIMPAVFSDGRYVANEDQIDRLAHYQMAPYAKSTGEIADTVKNLQNEVLVNHIPVEKLNLYHTSPGDRERTMKMLKERGVGAALVYSEVSSLECSPPGIDKGTALEKLSHSVGLAPERIIMVGDADNDLAALRFAGLAVAMGNANSNVQRACGMIVADNDHDGCAQAIRELMLQETSE